MDRYDEPWSDVILYTSLGKSLLHSESLCKSFCSHSSGAADITNGQGSMADTVRVSLSSAVSSSSHGSNHEDFDALGDVFIWGEGIGDGFLGGGSQRAGLTLTIMIDASLPKALESAVVLDVHNIACGSVESFKGENRDSRESNNGYPSSSSKFQVQASSKKIFSTSVPGLQFRLVPPGTGSTYQSAKLSVCGPPATERYRQKSAVNDRLSEKSTVGGRFWEISG
ncbi:hypothetical protein B296_00054234 [Ensete ventricosum]|uniref:Uncharacterized protein n=1 Tax=Ensete ventricosum TaxID=4639 RepID=A0A426Y4T7_ENSVE|nr:hypothetical protein B296_00054234 [Ensete ventricosum]